MTSKKERRRLLFGGTAGASFVALTQIATRTELNENHKVAITCFAAVMPVATMFAMWPLEAPIRHLPKWVRAVLMLVIMIMGTTFIGGIAEMLWTLTPRAMLAFLGSMLISMAISGSCTAYLDAKKKKSSDRQASTAEDDLAE